MIELMLESYCHNGCRAFEPEVDTDAYYCNNEPAFITTRVMCRNRNLCKQLVRYLERTLRKDEMKGEPCEEPK